MKEKFSFSGRITRIEYFISYLLFAVLYTTLLIFWADSEEGGGPFLFLISIGLYWFILAQGTKRCHDLDNSGFFQFIPLYIFAMFFEKQNDRENKYGESPITLKNTGLHDKFELFSFLPKDKNFTSFIFELLSGVLFNIFLLVLFKYYFRQNEGIIYYLYFLLIIPCYLGMLIINNIRFSSPLKKIYITRQRMIYSVFFYCFYRLYNLIFSSSTFDMTYGFAEIFVVLFLFGMTYLPSSIYYSVSKKVINE